MKLFDGCYVVSCNVYGMRSMPLAKLYKKYYITAIFGTYAWVTTRISHKKTFVYAPAFCVELYIPNEKRTAVIDFIEKYAANQWELHKQKYTQLY